MLAVQTDNEECMYNLATSYYETDRLDVALALFERCIDLNKDSVDAMLGLAKVYQKKQDYKKAIEIYD